MILDSGELGQLSNHLGHSDEVHKTFYRQQESTIEKTHIVKILELVNSGRISHYKGKSLQDVSIDIISAATREANQMPYDDVHFDDCLGTDFNENVDIN